MLLGAPLLFLGLLQLYMPLLVAAYCILTLGLILKVSNLIAYMTASLLVPEYAQLTVTVCCKHARYAHLDIVVSHCLDSSSVHGDHCRDKICLMPLVHKGGVGLPPLQAKRQPSMQMQFHPIVGMESRNQMGMDANLNLLVRFVEEVHEVAHDT